MPRLPLLAFVASLSAACGPDPTDLAKGPLDGGPCSDAGASGAAPCPPGPRAGADGGAPFAAPPAFGEGVITRVVSRELVPLTGYRVDAKPGDWLLVNAKSVAVVSNEKGNVVDLGAIGGVDALVNLEPTAYGSLATERMELESISIVGGHEGPRAAAGHVLKITKRLLLKPLWLDVFVTFAGDLLKLESVLRSGSDEPAYAQTLGEIVGFGNVPTWVEGHGWATNSGNHSTYFLARESLGVAYALGSDDGRTLARFGSPDPAGFHESAETGERTVVVPPRGVSERRRITLAHGTLLADAVQQLPLVKELATERFELPKGLPEGSVTEVATCEDDADHPGSAYLRFGWKRDRTHVDIPKGCFGVRFTNDGHAPGPWTKLDAFPVDDVTSLFPSAGSLAFEVKDAATGALVPARLLVRGVRGTTDPSWGDDPVGGAALNVVYTAGRGERPLPPGRYRVQVHRGPEYSTFERQIEIEAGEKVEIEAEIERVVDTKGWISADLHVHAMPSPDAPAPLSERVLSLAGAGVEVAVATDHNVITDYGPAVRALRLEHEIASIVGDEVTTREPFYGHFNAFPLPASAAPIPWKKTTPKAIFDAARALSPGGEPIVVQVNHPRMGDIGYFDLLRLDGRDVARWRERSPLVDTSFDALEVFNGDHYANIPKVESCLKDWYALAKAGFRVTATGNSDSHKVAYHEAGIPRNWVRVPDDHPKDLDARAFIDSIRRGRVVVSSGPFVVLTVNGKEIGDTVEEGEVDIRVRVEAPQWIDVDRVEVLIRGEVKHTWTGPFEAGGLRFDQTTTREVKRGDFVTAVVRGSKAMFYLYRAGARPFAFTNPVWVQ
jgi:hypothetical protein